MNQSLGNLLEKCCTYRLYSNTHKYLKWLKKAKNKVDNQLRDSAKKKGDKLVEVNVENRKV